MPGKVIFVVSSNNKELDKGTKIEPTGWYLPEAAHPYKALNAAGYEIVFVSPKGGKAPMDVSSGEAFKDDKDCQDFLKNHQNELDTTKTPKEVNASDFKGLFYVGGHGPMFDLPENTEIAELAGNIYENGGVLGAVCHGTVGLLPVKLKNGEPVIKGKKVTSFTNNEEDLMNLSKQMPFMLETRLKETGANFIGADNWACNVQVDERLVTGQNPASAGECGEKMAQLLETAQSQQQTK